MSLVEAVIAVALVLVGVRVWFVRHDPTSADAVRTYSPDDDVSGWG